MTTGERILEVLTTRPPPGSNLDWFATPLLALATETPSVTLRLVPIPESVPPVRELQIEESGTVLSCSGSVGGRLFRPLLARLAMIAVEETGVEFQPYGGRYSLTRTGPQGPFRLDIEFTNTTASRQLTITRTPVAKSLNGQTANGSTAAPVPTEPAGA